MELLKKLIKEQKVEGLVKVIFPNLTYDLTKIQYKIVRYIAFGTHKRVCINAMTRYGKSQSVAIGICIYILLNKHKKVAIIAPTGPQAEILRNYIAELMIQSKLLMEIIELERTGVEKLRKEASRTRQTFSNGNEYRVFSAEGDANRLMGFGANIIVIDEACLIVEKAWAKITRMLGDNPEEAILIELSNPWDMATRYYKHWVSGRYERIHIGWKDALKEGRVTEAFIEEQRDEMTEIEFTVLYDSNFPAQAEDSLFNYEDVKASFRPIPNKYKHLKPNLLSFDVARMGQDLNVIFSGNKNESLYIIKKCNSWGKKDTMKTGDKVITEIEEDNIKKVNIDICGLGAPVFDRLERVGEKEGFEVIGCDFGGKATEPRMANLKTENYFRLARIFEKGNIIIDIPPEYQQKIIEQLLQIKWDFSKGSQDKRIVDPNKSPDFADSLVYFIWKGKEVIVDW